MPLTIAAVGDVELEAGQVRWLSADWRGSVGPRSAWGQSASSDRPVHPEVGFLGEIEVAGLV